MKSLLRTVSAALAFAVAATASVASDWTPPGPIKMMIAFRAGGGAHTQARLVAVAALANDTKVALPSLTQFYAVVLAILASFSPARFF